MTHKEVNQVKPQNLSGCSKDPFAILVSSHSFLKMLLKFIELIVSDNNLQLELNNVAYSGR